MKLKIYTVHHFVPERYVANGVFVPFVVGEAADEAIAGLKAICEEPIFGSAELPMFPEALPFETERADADRLEHPSFAEMRCHYHIWKHRLAGTIDNTGDYTEKPLDYVGFQQYRRAFWFGEASGMATTLPIGSESGLFLGVEFGFDLSNIRKIIADTDMIVPRRWPALPNIGEDYCRTQLRSDWNMLVSMLDGAPPMGQLARSLDYLHPCNMFVMRVELFREYMDWWWSGMSKLAERITPPAEGYRSRTFGFMSERLFTIWLAWLRRDRPELRILELPLLVGNFTEI